MHRFTQTRWFEIILLALMAGFTYLPRIGELTYYRDDWYFLYNALVNGPTVFIDIALHTRPIRGPLYMLYYSLFGLNPFPWHVTMYLTRLGGGIGALWLFNLVWPNRRPANFFMASLFLLFPGFLWWVSGFEFQPYVLSVALQGFSIAFTLKAIASESVAHRLGWTVAAILSGWAYLALVEYAIGMEAFRLLCVYLYVQRHTPQWKFIPSVVNTLRASALHLSIPVVFILWYQFLFDNWRRAQDAGAQLGRLFDSPLTLLWRLVDLARSFLNVSIFAWVVPFYQNFYSNRLRDILIGLVFAALVSLLVWVAYKFIGLNPDSTQELAQAASSTWQIELIWVGLLGTLAGVLPVVLANRVVTFERISQYSLPASMTGVIFLTGLVYSVFPQRTRVVLLASLLGLAVMSQHGLAAQAVKEEKTISDFWWQVVWRAPDIKRGTTLVAIYPGIAYGDGNDVVWGPANFIYAPQLQGQSPVTIPISGSRLESDSILDIIRGNRDFQQTDLVIKNITITYDYKNLLIFSQPSEASCVHAIDPRWRELSFFDQPFLHASVKNSKIENIVLAGDVPTLPVYAFGSEPPHEWCYYYQKADLARQQGDWPQVAQLGDEAQKLGLHPDDPVEWMPFVQAYALLDDLKQVRGLAKRINTEPLYQDQACQNLEALAEYGYPLSAEMQNKVDELFCE
ncbi:MAG TPA: hypothetical protein VFR47_33200 [Anaerolineales bacterium]|nr:hypothetical protein [Anaerolineales bacterium]